MYVWYWGQFVFMSEMERGKMKNKVCIITGASGGIGKAIAESLFDAGFKLVLLGRNEEKLKNVARGIVRL